MPTSHDCEDDECVDESAISPATVYMCMFWGLIVFEDEHQVVHMHSCLYRSISEVTTVSISAYETRVFLAMFPGSSGPAQLLPAECGLGNEAINII